MLKPKYTLGIDLAGAKNQKTTLAALHHYPREGKTFLLDVHEGIGPLEQKGQKGISRSGDELLLEAISEIGPDVGRIGVSAPLTLPPCMTCTQRTCSSKNQCQNPAVRWMREFTKKAARAAKATDRSERGPAVRDFTPYTQRPVELWLKHQVLPKLDPRLRFEIDETLGGNRAPLTARMVYLKRRLSSYALTEVHPKLTVSLLSTKLRIAPRLVQSYRKLEEGAQARRELLDRLSSSIGLFVYDRDAQKLTRSLGAFDALICALTALLSDLGRCAKIPKGFPADSGWIDYPAD